MSRKGDIKRLHDMHRFLAFFEPSEYDLDQLARLVESMARLTWKIRQDAEGRLDRNALLPPIPTMEIN